MYKPVGQHQKREIACLDSHPAQELQPRYRICVKSKKIILCGKHRRRKFQAANCFTYNNNLEPTRPSLSGYWTSTYILPLPTDVHDIYSQCCLSGWKTWQHYHQIGNQHHGDSNPNHPRYLQDLTIEGRTWHHREVLLVFDQLFGSGKRFMSVASHIQTNFNNLITFLTWSNVDMAGERPPWTLKILFSIRADRLQ